MVDPTVLGIDATVGLLVNASEAFFEANPDVASARVTVSALVRRGGRLALPDLEGIRALAALPLWWIYRVTDQQEVIQADADRWAELLWLTDRRRLLPRLLYAFPGSGPCTTTACSAATRRVPCSPGWPVRCGREFRPSR